MDGLKEIVEQLKALSSQLEAMLPADEEPSEEAPELEAEEPEAPAADEGFKKKRPLMVAAFKKSISK